jgi:hypothetical protein
MDRDFNAGLMGIAKINLFQYEMSLKQTDILFMMGG